MKAPSNNRAPTTPVLTGGPLAEPGIDEDSGEIVYAGADITKSGGTTSYCHDILYTTVFVQFLAPFTNWAWMFFLVVRR